MKLRGQFFFYVQKNNNDQIPFCILAILHSFLSFIRIDLHFVKVERRIHRTGGCTCEHQIIGFVHLPLLFSIFFNTPPSTNIWEHSIHRIPKIAVINWSNGTMTKIWIGNRMEIWAFSYTRKICLDVRLSVILFWKWSKCVWNVTYTIELAAS